MTQTAAVWIVIAFAALLANLPFLSERWFAVWLARRTKTFGHRLFEWLVCYAIAGSIGVAFEVRGGQASPKGWEFYAVTLALFATLSFPGFVWRQLGKHSRA